MCYFSLCCLTLRALLAIWLVCQLLYALLGALIYYEMNLTGTKSCPFQSDFHLNLQRSSGFLHLP